MSKQTLKTVAKLGERLLGLWDCEERSGRMPQKKTEFSTRVIKWNKDTSIYLCIWNKIWKRFRREWELINQVISRSLPHLWFWVHSHKWMPFNSDPRHHLGAHMSCRPQSDRFTQDLNWHKKPDFCIRTGSSASVIRPVLEKYKHVQEKLQSQLDKPALLSAS